MSRDPFAVHMGIYAPLYDFLSVAPDDVVRMTFEEVETVLGVPLPRRAYTDGRGFWTVDANQVQSRSWLAASRHPHPDHHGVTFLRAERLTWGDAQKQHDDATRHVHHARGMLRDPPYPEYVRLGWFEPHFVYVVHYPRAGLFKTGLTNIRTDRLARVSRVGQVVDTITVPNRWVAVIVEGELLVSVRSARREPPLWVAQWAGSTEFWDESMRPPALADLLRELEKDPVPAQWGTTMMRSAQVPYGAHADES